MTYFFDKFYNPLAYICYDKSSKISIVDIKKSKIIENIHCKNYKPSCITIAPLQNYAYIGDCENEILLRLDLYCNKVINNVSVIGKPKSLVVSPCGRFVYVVFKDKPFIEVLDANSLETVWTLNIPSFGGDIKLSKCGNIAYVTLPKRNQTAVIDLSFQSIIKCLDTGVFPEYMAMSFEDSTLFVGGRVSKTVTLIDTNKIHIEEEIFIDSSPSGLSVIEYSNKCLIALHDKNEISVLEASSKRIIKEIPIGKYPVNMEINNENYLAVVLNKGDFSVSILDTEKLSLLSTVKLNSKPSSIAIVNG